MNLYNKYRPKTFAEVIGNPHITKYLELKIKEGFTPQSILLSGERGTGKTTIARLYAHSLTDNVYEINVADNNGVEFAREFVTKCLYRGFEGRRVYILDEAHRLTNDAQTILLKLLEEPPEHIVLILCSTEPQKFIKTVLSRVVKFETKKPLVDDLFDLLDIICDEERIITSVATIEKIIDASNRIPRDAISILESLIGIPQDEQVVIGFTEEVSPGIMLLCRELLGESRWRKVADILKDLTEPAETIRQVVLSYFGKVLLSGPRNVQAFAVFYEFDNLGTVSNKNQLIKAVFKVTK